MSEALRIGPHRTLDTMIELAKGLESEMGAVVESYDLDARGVTMDLAIDVGPAFRSRRRAHRFNRRTELCVRIRAAVHQQKAHTTEVSGWLRETRRALEVSREVSVPLEQVLERKREICAKLEEALERSQEVSANVEHEIERTRTRSIELDEIRRRREMTSINLDEIRRRRQTASISLEEIRQRGQDVSARVFEIRETWRQLRALVETAD